MGKTDMIRRMKVDAVIENLYPILDAIDEELARLEPEPAFIADIHVCVEEIFVNIASYAYGDTTGQVEVELEVTEDRFAILFVDSGLPYNPLERATPDITLSASERSVGGLGIYMVKEMMDVVTYEYKEKKNWLHMMKNTREIK